MDDFLKSAWTAATLKSGLKVLAVHAATGTGLELWQQLRDAHGQTGLWPFLLDKSSDRELVWSEANMPGSRASHRTAQDILEVTWDYDEAVHLPDQPHPGRNPAGVTDAIGLIETSAGGCDIPRLLRWGGACNNGLYGNDVTTVLTYWYARFGAELMALTLDSLTLFVPHPPTNPAEVIEVGMQHDAFCPDISEDFDFLLQEQVHSHYWNFWWD